MPRDVSGYSLEDELGSGTLGHVYLARSRGSRNPVAIKLFDKSLNSPFLPHLRREIAMMKLFDHPNILKLIDVVETSDTLAMVMRLAQNGSLVNSLHSLTYRESLAYFRQIIDGLDYLHSLSICHRDLKAENVLIDAAGELLIADFGLSCWAPSGAVRRSCGSPHYAAPEVLDGGSYDGFAADVWSSGVILYAMLAVCTFSFLTPASPAF
jgi:BR serine/threonine kinase